MFRILRFIFRDFFLQGFLDGVLVTKLIAVQTPDFSPFINGEIVAGNHIVEDLFVVACPKQP